MTNSYATSAHTLVVHPDDEDMDIEHPTECRPVSLYDGAALSYDCVVAELAENVGLEMFFAHPDATDPDPHAEAVTPGRHQIIAVYHPGDGVDDAEFTLHLHHP